MPVRGHLVDELGAEPDRSLRPDDAPDERNREIHVLAVLDEEASDLRRGQRPARTRRSNDS